MQFVAGDAVVESLRRIRRAHSRAANSAEVASVWWLRRPAPVIHHHAEIEIVGVDHLVDAIVMGIGADPAQCSGGGG